MKKAIAFLKSLIFGKEEPKVLPMSNSYVIQVQNETDEVKNFVLFGEAFFADAKNYGSDEGIKIINLLGGTYGQLLRQSAHKPFKTGLIRVQSEDEKNLHQVVTFIDKNSNGKQLSSPKFFYRDPYQQQRDILDVRLDTFIDCNVHIESKIESKSTLTFSFFPTEIYAVKSKTDYDYKSRYNYNPVIIIQQNIKSRYNKIKNWFKKLFNKNEQ